MSESSFNGRFKLAMQGWDERSANFSTDRRYRYTLSRAWAPDGRRALVIGHNPSTADALKDDQTIRRLRQLLRDHDFTGFTIVNLFAWRSTDPAALVRLSIIEGIDVVGRDNDSEIRAELRFTDAVVAAWGGSTWKEFHARVKFVRALVGLSGRTLYCFGRTKEGAPRHPSRLPRSAKLEAFT